MKFKFLSSIVVVMACCIISSCGSDSSDPAPIKSNGKKILSFTISNLSPQVPGVVNETDKTVKVVVPNGTDLTSLVPQLSVSDKATVFPVSGVAISFADEITFKVTAEDGSTQDYAVSVEVNTIVDFTINTQHPIYNVQQDNVVLIQGTNFRDLPGNKLVFISQDSDSKIELPFSITSEFSLFASTPADLPLGKYKIRVFMGSQSILIDEVIEVIPHYPVLDSLSSEKFYRGDKVIIYGKYFQKSGNKVELGHGAKVIFPFIVSEKETRIEFLIPESADFASYSVGVKSYDVTRYGLHLDVVLSPTAPVITSIDKTTFKRGEVITIKGVNLGKATYSSNINFVPFPGGLTQIKSASSNAEGTELTYTIPADFPLDTYLISIEVGGEFSDPYKEVIWIGN